MDSCVGDSGGPLFVDTGGRIEQVGVVSYGRDCAQPLSYGIYSSVPAYRSWVGQYVALAAPSGEASVRATAGATAGERARAARRARAIAPARATRTRLDGSGMSGRVAAARGRRAPPGRSRCASRSLLRRYRNSERILSKLVWRMSRPLTR